MALTSIGTRQIATVAPGAGVPEVVRHMADRNVGSVIVVKDGRPQGIVTDRDLVLRVLRRGLSPTTLRVEQVMSAPVHVVSTEASPEDAVARMREHRVRRLPLVDGHGRLAGIVCLDDIVSLLSRTHADLAEAITNLPRLESEA